MQEWLQGHRRPGPSGSHSALTLWLPGTHRKHCAKVEEARAPTQEPSHWGGGPGGTGAKSTHCRWGRGGFSVLGRTTGLAVASGVDSFSAGGLGATGGTKSLGLAASPTGASSTIFKNLGLLAGTGGGSGVGGPRGDRWKDLSLSQFLEEAAAMPAELQAEPGPWLGTRGSGLGLALSRKQGGFQRLGVVGGGPSGGSLILRGARDPLGPGSGRLRPSGSLLESSGAGLASGRPRLGGGGGSRGLRPLEAKE